jgi:putative alpha-1,2-mannosidase
MTGAHSFVILADAVAKGIPYNLSEALLVMVDEATSAAARRGYDKVSQYVKYGYLPVDVLDHGCSSTLEYDNLPRFMDKV